MDLTTQSKARSARLARAAARNPQAWSVRRLGPVLFETTCAATGDRFEVVSAYNRIFFCENMSNGHTYRVDTGGATCCECGDFLQRQQPTGTLCKHGSAALAAQRFAAAERMVDDEERLETEARIAEAIEAQDALARWERESHEEEEAREKAEATARFLDEIYS